MRRCSFKACGAVLLAFASGTAVHAETITLAPVADATLFSESGDIASGADDGVFVGVAGNTSGFSQRRAVLRFDLSALPAGAVVNSVSLTLQVTRAANSPNVAVGAYRVTSAWGEGTSTALGGGGRAGPATLGSATWESSFYGTSLWGTSGGDHAATASATTILGAIGAYTWSDAALVSDVMRWIADPAENNGWILIADPAVSGTTAKRLASREYAVLDQRPMLHVDFTVPVPLPAAIWLLGSSLFGFIGLGLGRR